MKSKASTGQESYSKETVTHGKGAETAKVTGGEVSSEISRMSRQRSSGLRRHDVLARRNFQQKAKTKCRSIGVNSKLTTR